MIGIQWAILLLVLLVFGSQRVVTVDTTTDTTDVVDDLSTLPLPLPQSPYDPALGKLFTLYSFAAYQHPVNYSSISVWDCVGCCPLIHGVTPVVPIFDNIKQFIFGYLAYDSILDAHVLVFRGTVASSLINWIEDLRFSRSEPYKGNKQIKIHKGFYETWLLVRESIFKLIVDAQPKTLYCTGHSLGAALTQVAALDISESFPGIKDITVYNYGCPRIGNKALATYYQSQIPSTYRVVHWKDLVPHLPPKALGIWTHCGSEVWYDEDFNSNYTECVTPESLKCSDSVIGDSVYDHRHYFNMSNHDCVPLT